jgi:hypothetical protein
MLGLGGVILLGKIGTVTLILGGMRVYLALRGS